MGTLKGVHEEGLDPACGLFSFLPNPLKGMGPQKGRLWFESLSNETL